MNNILIIGAFHEIIELALDCGFNILGIIDNNIKGKFNDIKILGTDKDAKELFKIYSNVPIVLSPDDPKIRKKLYGFYSKLGFQFQNLISPKAQVSSSAVIGQGVVVQHNVTISSNVIIKDGIRININACIMHDSIIDKFTTIAPCALILGKAIIKNNVYVGANATILPLVKVGENSIIGAGAVVNKNINPNIVVAGVPAKQIIK